jgi:hypothetical protein
MKRILTSPSLYAFAVVTLIVAAAIGLRLYKATWTGMVYDEIATLAHFATDYSTPLTSYVNPNNNHVINSLMMNFCRVQFGDCQYSFRLHTMAFSVVYCLAAAYLAWSLVANPLLRVMLAAILLFQYSVFDLSYLGRGYSIALAAYFGAMALLVFLLGRPRPVRPVWLPSLVLVVANFLALGSMLSAVPVVLALNLCYILFVSHRLLVSGANRGVSLFAQLFAVAACSLGLLYLLYRHIWRDILAAKDNFAAVSLPAHLGDVLWTGIFASPSPAGRLAYVIFLALAAISLILVVTAFLARTAYGRTAQNLELIAQSSLRLSPLTSAQLLVLSTTLVTLLIMVAWRYALGLSLGFARNGVFLIPLFFLSAVILIDTTQASVNLALPRVAIVVAASVALAAVGYAARPSLHAVQVSNWQTQSLSGPLVRLLRGIDPQRNWSLCLTDRTRTIYLPLIYYRDRHGYRLSNATADFDVSIYGRNDDMSFTQWYRPSFFYEFDAKIALSPSVRRLYRIPDREFGPVPESPASAP